MENNNSLISKVENQRLFGKGVDFFKAYYTCIGIRNILNVIGVKTSGDHDWFNAVAEYVTADELASLYDRIISRESRKNLAASRSHRTPPEIGEEDPDDIISYLSKNPVYRRKMWKALKLIYDKRVEQYKTLVENEEREKSAVNIRFNEMKKIFDLNDREFHLLVAVFLSQTRVCELGDFDINRYRSAEKVEAASRILGILEVETAELLKDENNIRKYGLLDDDMELDQTFLSYLSGISSKPLAERFWTKYRGEVLPWNFHGQLAEKHGTVLKRMINAKNQNNILLFGVPGSGKSSFAVSLANELGRDLYFIAQNNDDSKKMSYSPAFRYAALAVAQKQLDPETSILVVDEADKMLANDSFGGGLMSLFGLNVRNSRDGEAKGQLNSVLDSSCHSILWIANSKHEDIDPSSRRRFDYSVFFDDLSSMARKHIWQNALEFYHCENKLSEAFIERVSRRYHVNAGGVSISVKNAAAICGKNPELVFEKEVMEFLKAHCNLLGIPETPEEHEPARDYSLEGLNIRSGIQLPRLVEACKNYLKKSGDIAADRDQPRLSILLAGVPGSGKSEFVKYLAKVLDKKLCVKTASDLLNKYVGGTEQRIANAFAEAEAENSILYMDELDSMLSSRDGAVRSWEVSQVNTLLSELDRFPGIFIGSTNLLQRIDQAALRRFSFRLQFDYLDDPGKEVFFNVYFTRPMNLKKLTEAQKKRLFEIDKLTPSDFRNVRQQFFYLSDGKLSNSEIIEALASEVLSKTSGSGSRGLGEVVHKMGF